MHRASVAAAALLLTGVVTFQLRERLPVVNLELAYDPGAMKAALSRVPGLSIDFEVRHAALHAFLARLMGPRATGVAANDSPAEAPLTSSPPISSPMTAAVTPRESGPARGDEPEAAATSSLTVAPTVTAKTSVGSVTLDFSRISPDGPSVLAGRAAPGASVTVYDRETPIGTATAGPEGEWSMATEHKFSGDAPEVALRAVEGLPPDVAPATPADAEPDRGSDIAANDASAAQPPAQPVEPPAERLVKELERSVATARAEAQRSNDTPQETVARSPEQQTAPETQSETLAEATAATPVQADVRPVTQVTPVPIEFVYREATLTESGRHALSLLVEYVKLKDFRAVTLSGHADERGGPDYNMQLSRERLAAIEHLLRAGGYRGRIDLLPRGEAEPFTGVDRTRLPPEEVMQLDRRVELRVAQ